MTPARPIRVLALSLVLLSAPLALGQDIIKLKNGNSFRGRIVSDQGNTIQVKVGQGMTMTFPREDVADIVRGKAVPVPPKPAPAPPTPAAKPVPPPPADQPFARLLERFRSLVADAKYADADRLCSEAEQDPGLAGDRPRIALLRKDMETVRAVWGKTKAVLPELVGKEATFRDGVGRNVERLDGDKIVMEGGAMRPFHELDAGLALDLAGVTDHRTRGLFYFYSGNWHAAQTELALASAEGRAADPAVLARIQAGLTQTAAKQLDKSQQKRDRKERRLADAERHKANNQFLKLIREARRASSARHFPEALNALESARQVAAQLPPARMEETEKEAVIVTGNMRIIVDINVGPVTNPIYVEEVVREQDRVRGKWKRKNRRDQRDEVDYETRSQVAQQIAMPLTDALKRYGYIPLDRMQVQEGDRTSVLRVDYFEEAFSVLLGSSIPPMPSLYWTPTYGTKIEIRCHLEIFNRNGQSIWEKEIRLSTPPTGDWGVTIRQTALGMLQQKLHKLTFGIEPREEQYR